MDRIYLEAVNKRIQHHSEEIGRIKQLGNVEPIWSESRKLFKRKQGAARYAPFGVPSGTVGVYRLIHEPTGETTYIGNGVIADRLGRHRLVFNNKGRDVKNPGGTTNGSAAGQHMYKYDTYSKNWFFSWCDIGNKSLAEQYEDLLIKLERPIFNNECLGGK